MEANFKSVLRRMKELSSELAVILLRANSSKDFCKKLPRNEGKLR